MDFVSFRLHQAELGTTLVVTSSQLPYLHPNKYTMGGKAVCFLCKLSFNTNTLVPSLITKQLHVDI